MLHALVAGQLGRGRADRLLGGLMIHPSLLAGDDASRAVIAQALAVVLLDDLLARVPAAAAYAAGERLTLDHAAVRTVRGVPCGELAEGAESVARLLRPLGYAQSRPADNAWRHLDLPADVPHFLVGEVDANGFSEDFRMAAARIVVSSHDPLTSLARVNLDRLAADGRLPARDAESLLGELAAAFARHHATPTLSDYETVKAESDEMAWIATEGTAFTHLAVGVEGPHRVLGPVAVERPFKVGERSTETRMVPGPWFEVVTASA